MSPVVHIENLVKCYGPFRALDGLNLELSAGEVHGFLGPNGAGKSTTIRVLLGLLRADSGVVELFGGDPWRDAPALHRRLAYVPGDVNLWPNITGLEAINLIIGLRGRSYRSGADRTRRDELIDRFELDPSKKCRAYSKGNRQKVALIAALSVEVDLLLLDEPTSGLDPLMEAVFQEQIQEASQAGATVLLSSHILSEVERLCDRVSIVRAGRTVETGTLSDLRHLAGVSIDATTRTPATDVPSMRGVHDAVLDGDTIAVTVDAECVGEVVAELSRCGIVSLTSRPPSLDEMFLRYYGSGDPR